MSALSSNEYRYISKLNYAIHTDAIKEYNVNQATVRYAYANEADILNTALYGMVAKDFKNRYPDKEGNLRDNSTVEQLMIMNNLQTINAQMIKQGMSTSDRFLELYKKAVHKHWFNQHL